MKRLKCPYCSTRNPQAHAADCKLGQAYGPPPRQAPPDTYYGFVNPDGSGQGDWSQRDTLSARRAARERQEEPVEPSPEITPYSIEAIRNAYRKWWRQS